MTTDREAVAALRRAAKKYERAQAARDAAMSELTDAMRQADAAGVPRLTIQQTAGVARATVYAAVQAK